MVFCHPHWKKHAAKYGTPDVWRSGHQWLKNESQPPGLWYYKLVCSWSHWACYPGKKWTQLIGRIAKVRESDWDPEKVSSKDLTGETDHYESVPSSRPTSVLPNNSVQQPAASSSVMYKDCVVNMYSAPYFPPFPHYPPYQMPPGPSSNDSYPPYQMPPGPPSNNSWSSNDKLLLNSYISYLFTHFIYSLQERGFMPSLKGYCNYLLLYFTLILLVLYHFSKGIYYLAN